VATSPECGAKLACGIVHQVAGRLHESMGVQELENLGVGSNFLCPAGLLVTSKGVSSRFVW